MENLKLLALQNLSTVIHNNYDSDKYAVGLIQTPLVGGKCVSHNSKQFYFYTVYCLELKISVNLFSLLMTSNIIWI